MKQLHDIKLNQNQNLNLKLPVKIYVSLPKYFFTIVAGLFPSILFLSTMLNFNYEVSPKKIILVVIGVFYFIFFIWFSKLSFNRFRKNVKYWGVREPILSMTLIGIDYLNMFNLNWQDIEDVKLYNWNTGGLTSSTIPQIVIVTSQIVRCKEINTLEYRNHAKQTEFILDKIKDECPDFPIERTIILDIRIVDYSTEKLAMVIKQLWEETKKH